MKPGLMVQYYKPECSVGNGITAFKVKVIAKVQNVSECLSGWHLLNHRTFCCQTWYGYATRAYMIKIWLFYTAGSFATKLGLIVQHHKPECSVEKWDYCIQGQGHSKGSKCQWMFVRMICSEPHNILLPNLVWLCSFISQSVMQKYWFTVFNVKVTARAYIIKIWVFL